VDKVGAPTQISARRACAAHQMARAATSGWKYVPIGFGWCV
jgi:hypothetical protein